MGFRSRLSGVSSGAAQYLCPASGNSWYYPANFFPGVCSMTTILRPLSLSELLDRTFFLYRQHFTLFVGIVALPQLIVLALQLTAAALGFDGSIIGMIIITLTTVVVSILAITAAQAATVIAVSDVHLERPVSIGAAYSAIKGRLMRIIGIIFGVDVGVIIGFMLLIVPGIYLALTWALSVPVAVLEGTGLGGTTARSSTLTKGDKGRIFVVAFLLVILTWVVMIIIDIPILMLARVFHSSGAAAAAGLTRIFSAIGSFISTSLIGPLMTIALTLIYYDNRVRKEGFDLQLMMATMQQSGPQSIPAATS
jgi:hypothetical protein